MFRCFYLGWYIYILLVRDWLIDEQALGTQYCFVWRDTGNSWSKMVSFLHDLHKFCFSLHILFVKSTLIAIFVINCSLSEILEE